jgi:hypothetical protein
VAQPHLKWRYEKAFFASDDRSGFWLAMGGILGQILLNLPISYQAAICIDFSDLSI